MCDKFFFTVFIPAYNRADTLPRLFESLERQTFNDFEVIVVDDGSSDNTKEVVNAYINKTKHKVRYFYQRNAGKHIARNLGVKYAEGVFFNTIDSDDIFTDDSLEVMWKSWNAIKGDKKEYAGVMGVCADMNGKKIIGDKFPKDTMDSNHVVLKELLLVKGDKTQCIKTSIMRKFPFPSNHAEKYIAESIVWNRIGLKYKFRCINNVLKYVEYLPGGLSANTVLLRATNYNNSILYYKEYINDILPNYDVRIRKKIKATTNYVRFSFHGKVTVKKQKEQMNNHCLYWFSLLPGWIMYKKDYGKISKKNSHG